MNFSQKPYPYSLTSDKSSPVRTVSATAGLSKAASISSSFPSMHFLGGGGGGVFAFGGCFGGSSPEGFFGYSGTFGSSLGGY
jgi:hypothetical protein